MPETPLRAYHEARGAKVTTFAGWTMPLQYLGVVAEHRAVRNDVGVFDVSHLGRFVVDGPGAIDIARRLLCNDLGNAEPGRAQYTMALNDAGGVEDDVIVWRVEEECYWVLPNGTNFHEILGRFVEEAEDAELRPMRDETVLLAIQGPRAPEVVGAVLGTAPRRFRTAITDFRGESLVMAGTGYTGEAGAEIAAPISVGRELIEAFVAQGAALCGLGARDTLRLEMGYPLWGQDLDPTTTPLEAGLDWVVDWDHDFVGRDSLLRQRDGGMLRQLIGFKTEGRQIPRHDYPLRVGGSRGRVTSGNFSPTLECGIGLGYVSPPTTAGEAAEVEIRGRWHAAQRVEPPFIER